MPKSSINEVLIDSFKFPNIGKGRLNDETVEIKNALPGQLVEALTSKKKGKLTGRILKVLKRADNETANHCENLGSCGGCTFQTLPYEDEIKLKQEAIYKIFQQKGYLQIEQAEVVLAPNTYGYRNKMEFSFGDEYKDGPLNLGLRNPGSYYEVCDGSLCNICHTDFTKIVLFTRDYFRQVNESFYHRTRHTGSLRHLVIRKGERTGDILVNLITSSTVSDCLEEFTKGITELKLEGKIKGILHTINDSVADVVRADEMKLLYGIDFIEDIISGLRFKIYPFSFFQTNTLGAEKLYETVKEFCGSERVNTLFDLYCGTGTIAQILSQNAEHVYGIEIVESAIKAARENTVLNGIKNCSFIVGDVLKEVGNLTKRPDIIVLDPPREGIHPKAINPIIEFGAAKIVYVSCKPTSLIRDLEVFLSNGYRLEKVRIHDMFPRSYHVECVALLVKDSVMSKKN